MKSPVKKLVAALFGLVGLAWWKRRVEPPALPAGPDPAEALRTKLAEAREAAHAQQEDAVAEQPVDEADVPDVGARRSEVHDRARRAIEDLSTPEE